MTEHDRETYLYKMRYSQFLYERRGEAALRELEDYEIQRMARTWNELGERHGRSLPTLIELLWKGMGEDFAYEISESGEGEVQISCTRCPFAELSLEAGMKEVGFSTYCMSDYGIVAGFNPRIEFSRRTTLMEGHPRCDHHYKLAES